jgi:hypothetical protein
MLIPCLSRFLAAITVACCTMGAGAAKFRPNTSPTPGDLVFEQYFEEETRRLEAADLTEVSTLEEWRKPRPRRFHG